jgi:copper transport protein
VIFRLLERRRLLLFGCAPIVASVRPLVLAAFAWLCISSAAFAHAVLQSSEPAADSAAATGPTRIELSFNEPVQLLELRIIDTRGNDLTPLSTAPQVVDGIVSLKLDKALPDGRYLLSWRVGSLDGHVVGGSFGFGVGKVAATSSVTLIDTTDAQHWPVLVLHALARVLMLFAVGIVLFRLLMKPASSVAMSMRPAIRGIASGGAVVTLLFIAADGTLRAGLPALDLFMPSAWSAAMAAPTFWPRILSVAGLLLLALPARRASLMIGTVVSLAAMADSGHALALLPWGLGQALMILHGLTAALWIGAIWPLRLGLSHDSGPATAKLFQRFQSYGAIAMGGTLASGIGLAWILLPRWDDLWQSDYGVRLTAKLAFVAVMTGVAVINRLWLTQRALSGDRRRTVHLRRVLAIDLIVAAGVVVLAVGLSLRPPPGRDLHMHLEDDRYAVELTFSPGRKGDNSVEIALHPKLALPADPLEIDLRLSGPGIEAMSFKTQRLAAGRYRISRVPLWIAGPWRVRLDVLIDGFTKVQLEGKLMLNP